MWKHPQVGQIRVVQTMISEGSGVTYGWEANFNIGQKFIFLKNSNFKHIFICKHLAISWFLIDFTVALDKSYATQGVQSFM